MRIKLNYSDPRSFSIFQQDSAYNLSRTTVHIANSSVSINHSEPSQLVPPLSSGGQPRGPVSSIQGRQTMGVTSTRRHVIHIPGNASPNGSRWVASNHRVTWCLYAPKEGSESNDRLRVDDAISHNA
jgi:hypothetical protein